MGGINLSEFDESTVDKVYRLLELLEEMERHPALRGKFALHGGTAINLFMLDVPRLSVDIDVSYIGVADRDEMLCERPLLEEGIVEVGSTLGYTVSLGTPGHAGATFLLRYRGPRHEDNVKIDSVYLNRVPLADPIVRTAPLPGSPSVRTFSDAELVGGKVKAFFDRVKIRDLFDIVNLRTHLNEACASGSSEFCTVHEAALYYASLSARFPFGFEERELRFADCKSEVEQQLYPMLRKVDARPSLETMMNEAAAFVSEWVLPRSDDEREYLERMESGDYCPELLFGNTDMADRARRSPQALWKVTNLKKRQ